MAYVDATYYAGTFKGTAISDSAEFARLADIATDIIDGIVLVAVDLSAMTAAAQGYLQKAAAYEVELLYKQGGIDAITGMSSDNHTSARVGNISVTKAAGQASFPTVDGLPVSAMTIRMLRLAGLMRRLVAEDVEDDDA